MKDLKLRFNYLNENSNNESNITGKNIRKCLKLMFPKTKFSVRYSSFANGDAFNISYLNGPIEEEIYKTLMKFDEFSLRRNNDLEIDCIKIKDFQELFGSVSYIVVKRDFTEAVINKETERVIKNYKGIHKSEVFKDIFELISKYGQPDDKLDFKVQNKFWINVDVLAKNRLRNKNL